MLVQDKLQSGEHFTEVDRRIADYLLARGEGLRGETVRQIAARLAHDNGKCVFPDVLNNFTRYTACCACNLLQPRGVCRCNKIDAHNDVCAALFVRQRRVNRYAVFFFPVGD